MTLTLQAFKKSFRRRIRRLKNGCWEWIGKVNNYGYGRCQFRGKEMQAHRVSYAWKFGEIPEGMVIDHLCRNRRCVNPFHMEVVTVVENVVRGAGLFAEKKRQTHCVHGHPLSNQNLRIRPDGHRACRACARDKTAQYRRERKVHQ